jgi:lipopolysaccharide export system permease protein
MFWAVFDLINQITKLQELKLKGTEIALYYAVLAPKFLIVGLPIGLLLALLMTLTTLSRHNEITAMRAAGISLWRIAFPLFGVGLLCSAGLFLVNEFWVPDCENRAETILTRHISSTSADARHIQHSVSFNNERDGRHWEHIGTYNLDTGEMTGVLVKWLQPDGSILTIFADRAVPAEGGWNFYNVTENRGFPETKEPSTPILHTNSLLLPFHTETPTAIKAEIHLASRIKSGSARELDVGVFEIRDYLRFHPDPKGGRTWLYTQYQGRLAAPWACLVVVLIALPFGAASGRRNVAVGVASAIFLCFGFYVLQQFGLALGSGGYVPAWSGGWFPIMIFGGAGLWLTARAR